MFCRCHGPPADRCRPTPTGNKSVGNSEVLLSLCSSNFHIVIAGLVPRRRRPTSVGWAIHADSKRRPRNNRPTGHQWIKSEDDCQGSCGRPAITALRRRQITLAIILGLVPRIHPGNCAEMASLTGTGQTRPTQRHLSPEQPAGPTPPVSTLPARLPPCPCSAYWRVRPASPAVVAVC